ncbi:MAG: AAA family ATPase [Deltaproteobacteria bacterium]|nr:AAA family ATPase [Candidatus Desulfobacula maris]
MTRFSDDGGKNKNGWCTLFVNPDGSAGGAFGNWKDVEKKWFYNPNGKALTGKQQQDLTKQIAQAQEKAELEQKAKQAQAAKKADEIWNNAKPADPRHDYLVKKQIRPHGIKQSGKVLIIPVYGDQQQIISVQEIFQNGTKKFLPGGKIKGGSFIMGDIHRDDTFYIGEGFATMATIRKSTDKPCIVAFNSGNLKRVAQTFKDKYPEKKIIIAADNDLETEKKTGSNPGRIAGEEAARAIGAQLFICPVNSDFNDLQQAHGIDTVRKALKIKKKQFQLKRLSEIEFKPPEWLINSLFEKDTLNMVFGDPGAAKSFYAIDLAACIATGKDFHGMEVKPGPVVYIAGEGQNGIKRRFMAWGIRHNYNTDEAPIFISLMPAGLCDPDQAQWVINAIKQVSEDCGKPVLIVFDTVARNFGPGDENSTQDMSGFISGADLIREQSRACLLLVHHTGHGDKSRGRGAMALKGALDAEFRLEKDDLGTVRVTNTKMKDFKPPAPMAFKIRTVELGITDEDGEEVTSAILDDTEYQPLPTTQGKNGRGKWQNIAIEVLQNLYETYRQRLISKEYDPDQARVKINDWRIACSEKGMSRQAWARVKETLPQTQEVKFEGDYVYCLK